MNPPWAHLSNVLDYLFSIKALRTQSPWFPEAIQTVWPKGVFPPFGKFNTDELNSEEPTVFMNVADIPYVGRFTESPPVFVDAAVFTDFQSVPEPKEQKKKISKVAG